MGTYLTVSRAIRSMGGGSEGWHGERLARAAEALSEIKITYQVISAGTKIVPTGQY